MSVNPTTQKWANLNRQSVGTSIKIASDSDLVPELVTIWIRLEFIIVAPLICYKKTLVQSQYFGVFFCFVLFVITTFRARIASSTCRNTYEY